MTISGTNLTLVIGGAASGKSAYAEALSLGFSPRIYIATAENRDDEMAAKIAAHQSTRGAEWQTLEAPLDLAAAIENAAPDALLLVDCLTMWLANQMAADRDIHASTQRLISALTERKGPTICVTNELGAGLVPMERLSRQFRNHQGRLNQAIAAVSDRVLLVVAGLPLALKGDLPGASQ